MKSFLLRGWRQRRALPLRCPALVMGSPECVSHGRRQEAWPLFDRCLAGGINAFDTARHYRHGEETLGAWLRQRNIRQQVIILSKGGHPTREAPASSRVTAAAIDEDIAASLQALGTDYIDLYALHRDDPAADIEAVMACLHRHVMAGRLRAIGLSNWSLPRIQKAMDIIARRRLTTLSFASPQLSLAQSRQPRWPGCVSADDEMQRWHRQQQLPLLAWSSLAGGLFSGSYSPDHLPQEQGMRDAFCHPENWRRLARARELAQRKQVSAAAIALAWVLHRPFPCAAITAPESIAELEDSLAAARLDLSEAECRWLTEDHHVAG